MDPNDVKLNSITGLDAALCFSIATQYTNGTQEETKIATEYLAEYSKKTPVVALPEEDSLYINGDLVKVIGSRPYYIFSNGTCAESQPNISYTVKEFRDLTI